MGHWNVHLLFVVVFKNYFIILMVTLFINTFMCGVQFLSFPSRVWIWAPCIGSMESQSLDLQGSPWNVYFLHSDAASILDVSQMCETWKAELNWRLFSSFLASPGEQACDDFPVMMLRYPGCWEAATVTGWSACLLSMPLVRRKWTGCYFQLVKDYRLNKQWIWR